MSAAWTVIGFVVISLFLVLILALCKVAGQADAMANYEEEYAQDLIDEDLEEKL